MMWGLFDPFIFEAIRKVPAALYPCISAGAPSGIRGNETAVSLSYLGRKEGRKRRGERAGEEAIEHAGSLWRIQQWCM